MGSTRPSKDLRSPGNSNPSERNLFNPLKDENVRLILELKEHKVELEAQTEALRASEADLQALNHEVSDLYDNAPIPYLTLDESGTIRRVNLIAASLLGAQTCSLQDRPFRLFVQKQDYDKLSDHLGRCRQGEPCVTTEIALDTTPPHTVQLISNRIQEAQNCHAMYRTVLTDITERKKAEIQLLESEERYRTLFNALSEGLILCEVICDEEGRPCDYRYLEINRAAETHFGFNRDALIGKTVRKASEIPNIHEQPSALEIETWGRVALTGVPAHLEIHDAGRNTYVDTFAFCPMRGRFGVLFMDITGRKQAERRLHEMETSLRTLIRSSSQALALIDPDGTIRCLSRAASDMLGYDDGELEGRHTRDLLAEGHRLEAGFVFRDFLAKSEELMQTTLRLREKSGASTWFSIKAEVTPLGESLAYLVSIDKLQL